MLIPNRFSNLKFSLINTTSLVVDYLLQEQEATTKELLSHLYNFSKDFNRDDVLRAITLLYALGKVNYSEKRDTVNLINISTAKNVVNA